MTSMELLELLGQIDEKYIQKTYDDMWRDEVSTSASERVIAYKRRVPLKRKLVIALVAALMLMLVGCAVLWMKSAINTGWKC